MTSYLTDEDREALNLAAIQDLVHNPTSTIWTRLNVAAERIVKRHRDEVTFDLSCEAASDVEDWSAYVPDAFTKKWGWDATRDVTKWDRRASAAAPDRDEYPS
jgi:hypothetical protein